RDMAPDEVASVTCFLSMRDLMRIFLVSTGTTLLSHPSKIVPQRQDLFSSTPVTMKSEPALTPLEDQPCFRRIQSYLMPRNQTVRQSHHLLIQSLSRIISVMLESELKMHLASSSPR